MMKKFDTYGVFGPSYADVDYESASDIIIEQAKHKQSFGVSALAVHGLITSLSDPEMKAAVEQIDLIVPDGQPVRWVMNYFHQLGMKDRVYGPTLTLHVLEKASKGQLNVYLYGSTEDTISKFSAFIRAQYPGVNLCGVHVDRFREATPEEDQADIKKINTSGAHIVLVGRGCPRQEKWVAAHKGKIPAAMLAVGAAFDFHAGNVSQAPSWMQDRGLEWLYRLIKEPQRLWKRYLVTNSQFIFTFLIHSIWYRKPTKE
jgi:N-acetylglucosaminyldiphosphoundecaprenol N-acetyl-beta-D-mannosaminyltransferase